MSNSDFTHILLDKSETDLKALNMAIGALKAENGDTLEITVQEEADVYLSVDITLPAASGVIAFELGQVYQKLKEN